MAKNTASASVDQIVRDAVEGIVERVSASIQRSIQDMVAAELRAAAPARTAKRAAPARGRRRRPARAEITKWVADRRARRVPTFVIEMVGLDTKKAITAKFGENAVFEKNKPAPATISQMPKPEAEKTPAKAKAPVVRKAAAK